MYHTSLKKKIKAIFRTDRSEQTLPIDFYHVYLNNKKNSTSAMIDDRSHLENATSILMLILEVNLRLTKNGFLQCRALGERSND